MTWGKLKYGNTSIFPFALKMCICVCFYMGVVWPLKAGANSSSYNETSPVLISYLSTNSGSGSGGSLCLIASLKSHKAVWHSQDANPSQLGHFWWGETSRGGKLQWLGGREKKGPCQTELSSGEPRCQHPWGGRAGSRSSSRLTRPTNSWARQLAGAPVDSTFLSQWLFLSPPTSPSPSLSFCLCFSSNSSTCLPVQRLQCSHQHISVQQWLSAQPQLCGLFLLNSNVPHYSNYLCRKIQRNKMSFGRPINKIES